MPFDLEIRVNEEDIVNVEAFHLFDADDVAVTDHEPFRRVATFIDTGVAVNSRVGTFETGDDQPALFAMIRTFGGKTDSKG